MQGAHAKGGVAIPHSPGDADHSAWRSVVTTHLPVSSTPPARDAGGVTVTDGFPPALRQMADTLAHFEMALPALMLVAGHRPLAFVAGQLLHVMSPAAALLGLPQCGQWAALLSDPAAADKLEQILAHVAQPDNPHHS